MEICAICYESRPPIQFFYLSCCGNNKICSYCLENLVLPRCPYCRQTIEGFHPKKPKTRETWLLRPHEYTSRIERRHIRRLLKLEIREEDRQRNRMRSSSI